MASYVQDTGRGLLVADTASLLTDVQTEFKTSLGDALNLSSSTPQGTLISGETIARVGVMRNNADVANQINPDVATGVFLDSLMALMGSGRGVDSPTTVQGVILNGAVGETTTIPAGARVQSPKGAIFRLTTATTIPTSGTTTGSFQSQENGPVTVELGVNWTIIDGMVGWLDPVTVPTTATVTLGTLALTDIQARLFRKQTLASQGRQSVEAIYAHVLKVRGVKSISVRENLEATPQTIDGVVFTRGNALWLCVDGGDDNEVAAAMLKAKSAGAGWDYGTSNGIPVGSPDGVVIMHPQSGQAYYQKFTRPDPSDGIPVQCEIVLSQLGSMADPQQAAVDSVMDWANGLHENEPGLVLGQSFSSFAVAGAISVGVPGLFVRSVKVKRVSDADWDPDGLVPIALWEKASINTAAIVVTVV